VAHSYPHCWRCDGPVIFRATDQWFISLSQNDLRAKCVEAIDRDVTWVPSWGKARIDAMMSHRPDWCISRQRAWGVPIVVFYCEGCDHAVVDAEVMRHVAKTFDREGADAWVEKSAAELLPEGFACPSCGGTALRKERDILDVWFDSGVSYANVAELRPNQGFPVDLYLEGSDQHRGWFNSSLIAAVGTRDRAPYKTVLTHGFVVDGQGRKLSKRLGNGVPMEVMLKKFGADIIRLWVASEDYSEDVRLSDEILSNIAEAYRKIRNTLRYALGSLDGFDPMTDGLKVSELLPLDRWAVEMTARWAASMHEAYSTFDFHIAHRSTLEFCSKTLSAFWFDVLKDRLYTHGRTSHARRSAQSALWYVADALCRLLAPILSFTADEAWGSLPGTKVDTVFLAGLPTPDEVRRGLSKADGAALVETYTRLQDEVRAPVLKAMEELKAAQQPLFKELKALDEAAKGRALTGGEADRKKAIESEVIGNSLDARVTLAADALLAPFVKAHEAELASLLIVSQVTLTDAVDGRAFDQLTVAIAPALGDRCARCWCYTTSRGSQAAHAELCPKCTDAVTADYPGGVPVFEEGAR
jgi:isoleucyl-tRNA synthetase